MTPKQAIFVDGVVAHGNQTKAALEAGCPEKSASVTATRWMKKPEIAQAISARRGILARRAEFRAEEVTDVLRAIVGHDPAAFFDEDGSPLPIRKLGPDERITVESFQHVDHYDKAGKIKARITAVKKADRIRAAELLAKIMGLLKDRVEVEDVTTLTDEERAARVAVLVSAAKSRASKVDEAA